jgi:hypothetical protein
MDQGNTELLFELAYLGTDCGLGTEGFFGSDTKAGVFADHQKGLEQLQVDMG